MNWFKKSQQDLNLQYQQLYQSENGVEIIGSGQNEVINIPSSSRSITARELLEEVKNRMLPVLKELHVRTIDTSPIAISNAQGLNVSNRPGVIQIDVRKIFDNAKKALPPTSQLDGVGVDPDITNGIVERIKQWILQQFSGTYAHEALHEKQYGEAWQKGQPFSTVTEGPAEQFEKQTVQRYYPGSY